MSHQAVELNEVKADLKDSTAASGIEGSVAPEKSTADKEEALKHVDITEHQLPHDELARALDTDLENGLHAAVAHKRHAEDGPNALSEAEKIWWGWKLAEHLFSGFSLLLWFGGILCFIVYGIHDSMQDLTLGIVLVVVVTATGIFSYMQELKSDNVMEQLLSMSPSRTYCMRDGVWNEIDAVELVKGDKVKIENGKKVPADVIMLQSMGVKVDNSSLTGEAEPLKRIIECTDPMPTRSKNLAFYGTNVVEGAGVAVVVRIGDATVMGQIAASVQNEEKPEPLMKEEINRFVHLITAIALFIGLVFLIASLAIGTKPLEALVFTIGIIVANVPEGLLATVTVSLTITAQEMGRNNVVVKSTLIVETLGSVTCIASDKTGTLTQNRMSVRNAIYPDGTVRVTQHPRRRSIKEDPVPLKMSEEDEPFRPYYTSLVEIASICNHANFDNRDDDILKRNTDGDASESALLKFAHSNADSDKIRKDFPEIACVSFNSTNKFMVTIHRMPNSKDYRICIKGAPERVMSRCSTYTDTKTGKVGKLDESVQANIKDANVKLASNGERVLAFGEQIVKGLAADFEFECEDIKKCNFPMDGFTFSGMLSLEDPPREDVPQAVKDCHSASITVIMVTGDHPLTGRSIAAQIGILSDADGGQDAPIYDLGIAPEVRNDYSKTGVVVTGDMLDDLGDDDWAYILQCKGIVFARTLPTQKQDIVKKLQKSEKEGGLGHVVAVTGDGVNDSPALKAALVGIAMGTGSEVAKEAADLVLMGDDFASIVLGIRSGRLIFNNLKKSIAYTLTSNIPEIIPFLAQIMLKFPLGMTTIMILCIDLGTDILPAISFAYEIPEADIMAIPPRNRHTDKLVTGSLISFSYLQIGIIQGMCCFTVFFECLKRAGFNTATIVSGGHGLVWSDPDDKSCIPLDFSLKAQDKFHPSNDYYLGTDGQYCAKMGYRQDELKRGQTAFLSAIVVCQVGCGLACKTRVSSLFTHGMTNMVFNLGLLQETTLIAALVYAPFLQSAFATKDIAGEDWGIAIPFAVLIVLYDETRKWWVRNNPNHWFKQYWYY
jgi:sodium/potassium-transporting ATPase subunit alpha